MKTSELFMDVFTGHGGSPCIDCQFCKRTHFTHEDQNVEELRAKAIAQPDRYMESDCDSIGWGYLDGRQFVWKCPCDSGARYEAFIWQHREMIAEYLKRRAFENLQAAVADDESMKDLI